METASQIGQAWPIIISVVAVIAWFVRLEAKVLYIEKDHERINKERMERDREVSKKLEQMSKQLSEVLQMVSHIEGKLEGFPAKKS
jgi:hypothetical protein